MDFLKNQAVKIREQLAGLTQSQRMLAGSLVVIMIMTLMWWSKYAGSSEMEDVLPQDFSAEDMSRISALLDSRGIVHKQNGNRLQVPADQRLVVLGILTFEQMGPRDTSSGFDEIIKNMDSPWNTNKKEEEMYKRAKEAMLAQIMREWPGVREARVLINNAQKRAFGEASVSPSATVDLKLKNPGDKPPRRMIESAADAVAGAVPGMLRSKVNVIIDGAAHKVQEVENESGTNGETWMDLVKEHERYFSGKIQDQLRWLDGVYVTVSVDPKIQQGLIEKQTYDKSKTFGLVQSTKEHNEENNATTRPPAEPGAVPNTSVANQSSSVTGGGAGGEGTNSNTSDNTTNSQLFPTWVHETIKSPAGSSAIVGASVSIPRSYFVRIFKTATGSSKEPDDAALQPILTTEIPRIKSMVMPCMSQTPEDKVSVNWYLDALPSVDVAAQPAAATSIPLALTGHVKEIAVGALAVISLFMVSMMVRKGTPAPIIPPRPETTVATNKVMEDIAGEASEGMQSMDALERDDDAVRTEQMVNQVSTMVKDNPDAAASLVKRWLNRA